MRRVLNDAGEADALVTSMQSAPSGLLRISVATDFGVNHLSPVLGEFLQEFPEITVNMVLNNRYVELISEGFDLAIRIGELEDSTLRARKLCETNRRMIASPDYFEKYGRPQKIDDLNEHKLLHYSNNSSGNVWKLTAPSGEKRQVRTAGWLTVNDGQSLLNAAIAGLGIAYLPSFLYAEAMDDGLIQEAIPELPIETQGIFAVYPPGRFTQPKVRAFIDFLVHAFADWQDDVKCLMNGCSNPSGTGDWSASCPDGNIHLPEASSTPPVAREAPRIRLTRLGGQGSFTGCLFWDRCTGARARFGPFFR